MRLQLVHDDDTPMSVTLADEDGDGIDDETGLPVGDGEGGGGGDADESDDDEDEPAADASTAGTSTWVLAVEDQETGDGRRFEPGAITWRELPLPFMATDETDEGHDGARLVANIVDIRRDGAQIIAEVANIESDDERVLYLQRLIANNDLRGVSVDLDQIEGTMTIEEMAEPEEGEDGSLTFPMDAPKMTITAGRIMGATAVPFPAFMEAQKLSAALVAGAGVFDQAQPQGPSIAPPVHPPLAWFADPGLPSPTRVTVTDEGRIFGHLAVWDSCHVGFQDRCVTPPRSASNYSAFHTGEVITAEGSRVQVGQITADSGHAPLRASAPVAAAHYDHTGWAAADVRCGEDDHGIWIAGALRSDITAEQLRVVMASDVSGDWRQIGGRLDLVGIASVNVPGFSKTQFAAGERVALVAAVPPCDVDDVDPGYDIGREIIAASIGQARWQRQAERDELAWSLGRHPAQRREALRAAICGS